MVMVMVMVMIMVMVVVTVTCQGGAPAVSCPQLSVAGADFADCNGEYR